MWDKKSTKSSRENIKVKYLMFFILKGCGINHTLTESYGKSHICIINTKMTIKITIQKGRERKEKVNN